MGLADELVQGKARAGDPEHDREAPRGELTRRGSSMPLVTDGARPSDPADRVGTGDLRALGDRLTGELVLPGDPEWDDARRAWNLAVDQRPFAVALVESVEDVVAVVEFAGTHGLRVAPQGTGHGASALAVLDGTILVKTSRLRG